MPTKSLARSSPQRSTKSSEPLCLSATHRRKIPPPLPESWRPSRMNRINRTPKVLRCSCNILKYILGYLRWLDVPTTNNIPRPAYPSSPHTKDQSRHSRHQFFLGILKLQSSQYSIGNSPATRRIPLCVVGGTAEVVARFEGPAAAGAATGREPVHGCDTNVASDIIELTEDTKWHKLISEGITGHDRIDRSPSLTWECAIWLKCGIST